MGQKLLAVFLRKFKQASNCPPETAIYVKPLFHPYISNQLFYSFFGMCSFKNTPLTKTSARCVRRTSLLN